MSRPKYRIKEQSRSKTRKGKLKASYALIIIFLIFFGAVITIIVFLSIV